jgi:hypothetical protein
MDFQYAVVSLRTQEGIKDIKWEASKTRAVYSHSPANSIPDTRTLSIYLQYMEKW